MGRAATNCTTCFSGFNNTKVRLELFNSLEVETCYLVETKTPRIVTDLSSGPRPHLPCLNPKRFRFYLKGWRVTQR